MPDIELVDQLVLILYSPLIAWTLFIMSVAVFIVTLGNHLRDRRKQKGND